MAAIQSSEVDTRSDDELLTLVGLLFESAASLRRVFEQRLSEDDHLSIPSFDILIRLARSPQGRLRMSDLAAQAALTPSGLTRSVDRLERDQLVTREVCPEDRRGAFAVLTDHGRVVMDQALPHHVTHIGEVLNEAITADEAGVLSDILRKVRDHLVVPGGEEQCPLGPIADIAH